MSVRPWGSGGARLVVRESLPRGAAVMADRHGVPLDEGDDPGKVGVIYMCREDFEALVVEMEKDAFPRQVR